MERSPLIEMMRDKYVEPHTGWMKPWGWRWRTTELTFWIATTTL